MDGEERDVLRRRRSPMRKTQATGPAAVIITFQRPTVPSIGNLAVTSAAAENNTNFKLFF